MRQGLPVCGATLLAELSELTRVRVGKSNGLDGLFCVLPRDKPLKLSILSAEQ